MGIGGGYIFFGFFFGNFVLPRLINRLSIFLLILIPSASPARLLGVDELGDRFSPRVSFRRENSAVHCYAAVACVVVVVDIAAVGSAEAKALAKLETQKQIVGLLCRSCDR